MMRSHSRGRTTVGVIVVPLIVLMLTFSLIPPFSHDSASALYCSDITSPLPSWIVSAVASNKSFYTAVSEKTSVPWEMLAAIHYRETNFSHTNPSNGQGIFQFVNGNGGPYPTGPVDDTEFVRQLTFMATNIQNDYVFRGGLNYTHRALTTNEPDAFRVQDTLFSYNGRASVYAQQANQYGFSGTLSPYEGSPYVMNQFDCPRVTMGIITRDYGSLDGIDSRMGTFTLYARLKSDSYWQSLPNWLGTSPVRNTIITSQARVTGNGWMSAIPNSGIIGTTGQNKPMEAFLINGAVEYSSYTDATGWQPTINRGMISGTVDLARSIQAIKIKLIDPLSSQYDVYYRTHVSNVGWMEWTKNGQAAGVTGNLDNHIEAVEVQLVPIGWPTPQISGTAFNDIKTSTYTPDVQLNTDAHVSGIGWQPPVLNDMSLGTIQQGRAIEAITVSLTNSTGLTGSILYNSQLAGIGWQGWVKDGAVTGTTGQGRQMEAFSAVLSGALGEKYDLLYRAHVQTLGWLGWAKNGQPVGSQGAGYRLESVETRLVLKDTGPAVQSSAFYNPKAWNYADLYNLSYSTHVSDIGWISNFTQNATGGTVGQAKPLEAVRFDSSNLLSGGSAAIGCTAFVKNTGWTGDTAQTQTCGTVGQAKPLEAVKLTIGGSAAAIYDIYYRVHLSTLGWQDWVKNGAQAGTPGSGYTIEAMSVKLVLKS